MLRFSEMLKGKQRKLDKNNNGKLDAQDFKMLRKEESDLDEAKPGLYANINAKKKRIEAGSKERMRKPGSEGAPSSQDFKDAAKTAKEEYDLGEDKDPCWDSHKQIGMKMKGGKKVPNCVPKNEEAIKEGKHVVSVTVSDPNHTMVSQRNEKKMRKAKVSAPDKDTAINNALAYYKKRGMKVHDHNYIGLHNESVVPDHMKGKQKPYVSSDGKGGHEVLGNNGQTKATFTRKEHGAEAKNKAIAHLKKNYNAYMKEELDEAAKGHTIEAHGIKGMKRTPWRQTFKHSDHLNDWAEKNDAEVYGTRDLEGVKKGKASSVKEEKSMVSKPAKTLKDIAAAAERRAGSVVKPKAIRTQSSTNKTLSAIRAAAENRKMKEEYELEEAVTSKDKMTSLRTAHDRHMDKALAANKAGDDTAVKAHQNKMAMIKSKMDKLKQNEEVELEENHLNDFRRYTQAAKNAKAKGDHNIAKDAEQKASKSAANYTRVTGKKPTHNEEVELDESHFKLGDKVKCKSSGMVGKVVKLDEPDGPDDKKYYTVKHENGKTMKHAPNDLTVVKEETLGVQNQKEEKQMKSYKQFVEEIYYNLPEIEEQYDDIVEDAEQLDEYESKDGVYRNTKKATYGTSYQGDDDESKPKPPTEKRGRGRPAGSSSGARQMGTAKKVR